MFLLWVNYNFDINSSFSLPNGKADGTPPPSLPRVRNSSLWLHPLAPWIWGTLSFRSIRVLINPFFEIQPGHGFEMNNAKKPPSIIPVFLPYAGCPHRCVFCNQTTITGHASGRPAARQLRDVILKALAHQRKDSALPQIAFYGGNFLGLKKKTVADYLDLATEFVTAQKVDSLRFSTRPDTIDTERLDIIKDFAVKTIELGVQSMDDEVLEQARRNHTTADTYRAVSLLKKHHYQIGLQMMLGLPGDNDLKAYTTATRIASLAPDFVRIYPVLVLKNSPLADWYAGARYQPIPLDSCITLAKKLYLLFRQKGVPVARMGLQVSQDLNPESQILAGPYHPAFGHLVYSEVMRDRIVSLLQSESPPCDALTITVHSRQIPQVRGYRNKNIHFIEGRFNLRKIKVVPDNSLEMDQVVIEP